MGLQPPRIRAAKQRTRLALMKCPLTATMVLQEKLADTITVLMDELSHGTVQVEVTFFKVLVIILVLLVPLVDSIRLRLVTIPTLLLLMGGASTQQLATLHNLLYLVPHSVASNLNLSEVAYV